MKNTFLKYSGSPEEDKVIKNVSHNLNEMWKKIVPIISEETTNDM